MPTLTATNLPTVVLTASRDGRYASGFVQGLLACQRHPSWQAWINMEHESDIARARGRLATLALERTQAAGVLFIDDDMHFTAGDFEAILAAAAMGCPVVGGLYSKRRAEGGLVYNPLPGGKGEEHPRCADLVRVRETGTGFLWIARQVLEQMQPAVSRIEGATGGWWHYFPAGTQPTDCAKGNEYVSEDYAFCRKAAMCGFNVWLHRGVRLGHEGKAVFRV